MKLRCIAVDDESLGRKLLEEYISQLPFLELVRTCKNAFEAMEVLQGYDWPGNVRQLVNTTRRLTVIAPGSVIGTQDIPPEMGGSASQERVAQDWTRSLANWAERQLSSGEAPLLDRALPEFEKTLIRIAMSQTNGHRQEAAKLLGWGRNTLTRKMKALQLD